MFGEIFYDTSETSHPPFGADFHSNPLKEVFKNFEGATRNTEMTGGSRVASVHDPRPGQKGHIDMDGIIEGGSALAAVVAIRCEGKGDRGPRVELVPSHGGCNLTRCLRVVQLQCCPRYPRQWFAGQGAVCAASSPTAGWATASGGARRDDQWDRAA